MDKFLAHPQAPVALTLSADFVFTIMDAWGQRLMVLGVPSGQFNTMRMAIVLGASTVYIWATRPQLFSLILDPSSKFIWIRAVFQTMSLTMFVACLEYLTLSDALTLYCLRPFPTAFLYWAVLGERFTARQATAAVVSFAAVVLVVQPDSVFQRDTAAQQTGSENHKMLGTIFVLTSMIGAAFDFLLLRKIGPGADPWLLLQVYSLTLTVMAPLWMLVEGTRPVLPLDSEQLWYTVGLAVLGLVGQMTKVMALQLEKGAKVAVLGYFQIVFGVIWQALYTNTFPSALSILGMAIIVVAGSWAAMKGLSQEDMDADDEEEDRDMSPVSPRSSVHIPLLPRGHNNV